MGVGAPIVDLLCFIRLSLSLSSFCLPLSRVVLLCVLSALGSLRAGISYVVCDGSITRCHTKYEAPTDTGSIVSGHSFLPLEEQLTRASALRVCG
jgi:hypothetical protein